MLVVATQNAGKLAELRALLAELPVDVVSVDEVLTRKITVIEDGDTFAENATKKAVAIARATMMLTGTSPSTRCVRWRSTRSPAARAATVRRPSCATGAASAPA